MIDTILDEPRNWILIKLVNRQFNKITGVVETKFLYNKIYTLITCTWCMGVWVSALLYWVWFKEIDVIEIAAVAGAQGIMHALEPAGE